MARESWDKALHFQFYVSGGCDRAMGDSLEEDRQDVPADEKADVVAHIRFPHDASEAPGYEILAGLQSISSETNHSQSVLEDLLAMAFRAGVAHGTSLKIDEAVREVLTKWVSNPRGR